MKNYTFIYFFNHSKFGFSNELTIKMQPNEETALNNAKNQVSEVYGSKMLKKFTFKLK